MKYTTEKILLTIFCIEIMVTIFVACFYFDLYQATVNGKSKINEYGQAIHSLAPSWSVTLKDNLKAMFDDA